MAAGRQGRAGQDIVGTPEVNEACYRAEQTNGKGRFHNVIFYIQNFATFGLPEGKRNEASMQGVLYPNAW